jgi:lysyl-tRNA synthetase class 2
MLARVRQFFAERSVMEVDTPLLSHAAPIATHIEIMTIHFQNGKKGYLHSSPEYAMKRLIAQGSGDIFQLSHVFRDGEIGERHNPEFTMIEWYRVGMPYDNLIQETLDLIRLFISESSISTYTYAEAFEKFAEIDYKTASSRDLQQIAAKHNLSHDPAWDKETFLHFLMGFLIEPQFKGLCVLKEYPASQAALAKTVVKNGDHIAERFEIYYNGMELANGFHELTDPIEQRKRFVEDNRERARRGKPVLPIDENFLAALVNGLPDCCGVAVGFDRLLMLQQHKKSINDVLPFSWELS